MMALVSCMDIESYAPDFCSNMFAISKSPVAFCPCTAICFSILLHMTDSIPVCDNILSLTYGAAMVDAVSISIQAASEYTTRRSPLVYPLTAFHAIMHITTINNQFI